MSSFVDELRNRAEELDAELEQSRYPGRSQDGLALAVVTGQGRLVGLLIADHATGGPHPQRAGPAVVEAVRTARQAAAQVSLVKMRTLLGMAEADTAAEASFEEFDFLSEDLR
ncbi:YbaB/EbfC family nucleoid-associated protein [Amycolatopsis sp. lyj-112]|uniref:YbaB/EbfC family nucleoid-associated protein n=1 Tax=Amycolatopsis sp. lyj-112 TaxID=2789288 RepID=UPI0039793950